ncbi:hypothetical protein B296_00011454 [Ensete ventricosum]|uniref:ADP/ATP translocase n=1 Tax=Ensete ventricosum TaxID=4639 RepID=A0A427AWT5_ENSVE|nr:hypothetical protein B296_00011454 [Ensete ventricosum]
MADHGSGTGISFYWRFASSAIAACFAEVGLLGLRSPRWRHPVTRALAITVANPTDLVKVRLQSEGKLPPGVPRRYLGALDAYFKIIRQEGIWSLWTGLGPNIARNAIINAAELASYDQIKQVKSRMMGDSSYKSTLDCFIKTLKTEVC